MVTKNAYKTVTFAKRILSYVCCSIDGLQRVALPIQISPIASKVYVQTLFFYTLWIEPVNLVLRHCPHQHTFVLHFPPEYWRYFLLSGRTKDSVLHNKILTVLIFKNNL